METDDGTDGNVGDNGDDGRPMDPATQLALLARVQTATEVEGWMPPTPVWHAPLLATTVAGTSLVGSAPSATWSVIGAVLGALALAGAMLDMSRRRRVRPRWPRKPGNVLAFYVVVVATTFLLAGLWGAIEWPSDAGSQVILLGVGWIATTAVFALGIAGTNRLRDRFAAGTGTGS